MLKSIIKTALATAITPVAIISDIVALPSSAYNNKSPFGNTEKLVSIIKTNAVRAIE